MKSLVKLLRMDEWVDSKLPIVFLVLANGILFNSNTYYDSLILNLIRIIVLALCWGSFYMLINDLSDYDIDIQANKSRFIHKIPKVISYILLTLFFMIGITIPFKDYIDNPILLLLNFSLFLNGFIYSVPPIRLKSRAGWGILAMALPRLIVVLFLNALIDQISLVACLQSALMFLAGIRWMLFHQVIDFEHDQVTHVDTVATRFGKHNLQQAINKWLYPIELFLLIITIGYQSTFFPIIGILSCLYVLGWFLFIKKFKQRWVPLFYDFQSSEGQRIQLIPKQLRINSFTLLDDFYNVFWIQLMLWIAFFSNPLSIVLIICHILIVSRRIRRYLPQIIGG